MKANSKQTAVKLTRSKIDTHAMVRVVTKYGKQCLHQVVTMLSMVMIMIYYQINRMSAYNVV